MVYCVYLKENEMNRDYYLIKENDKVPAIKESMSLAEHSFRRETLNQSIIEANNYISRQLSLPLASPILFVNSLVLIDEVPRCIERIYADINAVRGLETYDYSDVSFYGVLQKEKGISRIYIREDVLIVEADEQERELLKLDEDEMEILLIKGIAINENERTLAYYETASDTGFYRYRSVSTYE